MTDGEVLAGRYEIGAVLGRGGMAEVRAAWDRRLGRAVAVKMLLPGLAEQPTIRRRFEGEARAAARLSHPNAVAVFDVGEEGDMPFLVMEQVVGPTLEEEMSRGPLDAERLRRLGDEVLGAVGAAHGAGLLHRDIKPANVLLAPDGSAKVADFGIAKAIDDGDAATAAVHLTTTGQVLGTVAYMAPELLACRPATVQSDLYSVGVVLYESLSGDRPFAAPTPAAIVRAIDQANPASLRERRPALDPALVAVVERAMARNPDDRFASAADMAAALRAPAGPAAGTAGDPTVVATPTVIADPARFADPAPFSGPPGETAATPDGAARRRPAWPLTRRRIAVLAVAGFALALIAAAAFGGGGDDPAPPADTPAATVPPPTVAPSTVETPTPTTTATPLTEDPPKKGKGKH